MIKSTTPTQLTLLPQPNRRSGPLKENHSALRSAPSHAQPRTERTRSRPFNPAPRTAPANKSRQSLWYCLYLPQLGAVASEEQRECLDSLAQLAQEFSSAISLQPLAVVFEIRSGLKYFGGAESLHTDFKERVRALLVTRSLSPEFAYAACPTIEGSLLLARGGNNTLVYRKENLNSALGQLSIETLQLKPEPHRRLINMGIRCLGDLWRLPPAGLRRRFGSDFLALINKALGKAPEPIKNYLPPPAFVHSYELPYEVENLNRLRPVVDEMIAQLCDFLRHRELCASSIELSLLHERREATQVDIGLRQASRSQQHLMLLIDTHLDSLQIPAPVTALRLKVTQFDAFMSHSESLLIGADEAPAENTANSLAQFMERLQARLGNDQVKSLSAVEEHCPEYASESVRPGRYETYPLALGGSGDAPAPSNPRPLWLLDEPLLLSLRGGSLYHRQAITLLSGPERIEARWWSGDEVCRDYYIAREGGGSRLWIYRERGGERHWYLHGYFA
ncbi:MAG: Y-family DNA polymerase [Pseudohongiellaceae bacterium]